MKKLIGILSAIVLVLATVISSLAFGENFIWKSSLTDLQAITGATTEDRAVVLSSDGVATFYTHSSGAWTEMVVKGPYVDVRAYGADPTGVSDSTSAIQAAFDNITTGSEVFFPKGTYTISGNLTITQKYSFRIRGAGGIGRATGGVKIKWAGTGSPSGVMLDLRGVYNSVIENIWFVGTSESGPDPTVYSKTGKGTYSWRGPDDLDSSSIHFINCNWQHFTVGTQIGRADQNENNLEEMKFYACDWDFNTVGFWNLWPNNINQVIYDTYCTYNTVAIKLGQASPSAQSGSVSLYNASFAVNGTDIYVPNAIEGNLSEIIWVDKFCIQSNC